MKKRQTASQAKPSPVQDTSFSLVGKDKKGGEETVDTETERPVVLIFNPSREDQKKLSVALLECSMKDFLFLIEAGVITERTLQGEDVRKAALRRAPIRERCNVVPWFFSEARDYRPTLTLEEACHFVGLDVDAVRHTLRRAIRDPLFRAFLIALQQKRRLHVVYTPTGNEARRKAVVAAANRRPKRQAAPCRRCNRNATLHMKSGMCAACQAAYYSFRRAHGHKNTEVTDFLARRPYRGRQVPKPQPDHPWKSS